MSAKEPTQRDLLIRLDERTEAHYREFREFKVAAIARDDKFYERLKKVEDWRMQGIGAMGVISILGYFLIDWAKTHYGGNR